MRMRQVSEGGDSVPARAAAAAPEPAPSEARAARAFGLPCTKVRLPQQDNHCDCGLFVLAYVDFFVAGLPPRVRLGRRDKVDPAELEGARRASQSPCSILLSLKGRMQHRSCASSEGHIISQGIATSQLRREL